jgi:hydrogenase maturation protein HypF
LLQKGEIVAIKGLGGFQLACDGLDAAAVARLRGAKRRDAKPFALMARDLRVIARYCTISAAKAQQLTSPSAPIVILRADGAQRLPESVAPNLATLGFMLPTTPLHQLILQRLDRPVVMTSGNLSDEPPAIDNDEVRRRLSPIASYAVLHDRKIANRVDDSVVRVMGGQVRLLRRARGFAPAPVRLADGFAGAPPLLAMGAEQKAIFCLLKDGAAILSQHQGDLGESATYDDYRTNLALYHNLFGYQPQALVIDPHPEYRSSKLARGLAQSAAVALIEVQHHHAHAAACLAENGYPLSAPPVLGLVLDGCGWGDGGAIWGGEFLLADYRHYQRLATFKPVALLGGDQAAREPWRNLYAHVVAAIGWPALAMNFSQLELFAYLSGKPRPMLDAMLARGPNAPLASSCGRLFDAVSAALNLGRERQAYEGEAAARLEAIVDETALRCEDDALAYPFTIPLLRGSGLPYLEPLAMWNALLGDLILGTPAPIIAARFHKGLAKGLVAMTRRLAARDHGSAERFRAVALSGGCFQNKILLEEVTRRLQAEDFTVFSHAQVPAHDGSLALGQAVVGAAHLLDNPLHREGNGSCALGFRDES